MSTELKSYRLYVDGERVEASSDHCRDAMPTLILRPSEPGRLRYRRRSS